MAHNLAQVKVAAPASSDSSNDLHEAMVAMAGSADLAVTEGKFYDQEMQEANLANNLQNLLQKIMNADGKDSSAAQEVTDITTQINNFVQGAGAFEGTMAVGMLTAMLSKLQTESAKIQSDIGHANQLSQKINSIGNYSWVTRQGAVHCGWTVNAHTIADLRDQQNGYLEDEQAQVNLAMADCQGAD